MSWDLLDIDGLERLQAERRALTTAPGADLDMNRTPGRNYTRPFPLPENERAYFALDPWQRRALARRFAVQVTPRTNKAGLAGHAPDLLSMHAHDCHCGGKCGPCGGKGLGFLNPPPTIEDSNDFDFMDWFGGWLFPTGPDYPDGGGGGGGYDPGAGGMILQNDDCGRPPNHPSYGCECGSMWSDDYLLGCINPCLQGNQIEWRWVKDANGVETFIEECKPTATQGELDCPTGTVKKGAYCIEPMTAKARTPVSRQGGGSGGSGGSGGGSAGRQTPTNRGTPTTISQNPTQAALAAALQQAAAICQRTGKVYDQQTRKCVSQNPFGVIQENIGGLPVWEWALIAALGFIVLRKVSS